MTTTYLGNGVYEIHLGSGKKIELTESEIQDIIDAVETTPPGSGPHLLTVLGI